ncbi:MAG: hypothetical protein ACI4R8_04770 [Candidatus Caccovivens sp.]
MRSYKNSSDVVEALLNIEPVDLKSKNTSNKDAVKFCREVLTVLMGCENLYFNETEQMHISDALKFIGCATYKNVAIQFIDYDTKTLGDIIEKPNSIELPLEIFTHLIDTKPDSFSYGLREALGGEKNICWVSRWLSAQEKADNKIVETNKKEKIEKKDVEYYKNVREAVEALLEIEPVDLKSRNTSNEDAVKFCREVLTVLMGCENLNFNGTEQMYISDALKSIGCVKYKNAANQFKSNKTETIGCISEKPNSIEFPLECFTRLIDADQDTFSYGLSKILDGGEKHSWVASWLSAQEKADNKIVETNRNRS